MNATVPAAPPADVTALWPVLDEFVVHTDSAVHPDSSDPEVVWFRHVPCGAVLRRDGATMLDLMSDVRGHPCERS